MSIVIVGAGGHGRGILEILIAGGSSPAADPCVLGFLDDAPERAGVSVGGVPVLGRTDRAAGLAAQGQLFLIGIGDPAARHEMAVRLEGAGVFFTKAVHPSAVIYRETKIAEGSVIAAGVVIAAGTRLERHTLVNLNATVGHDCRLEEFATVGPGANLGGNVWLERCAFVGMNATVVPGRRIGAESILGAGSVLLEDLPDGVTAFGVPARIVQRRSRA